MCGHTIGLENRPVCEKMIVQFYYPPLTRSCYPHGGETDCNPVKIYSSNLYKTSLVKMYYARIA